MRLIVGLGNPGREYALTPHNLGFAVVERLARELHPRPNRERRGQALLWRGRLDRSPVLLAQPQTYMNQSGSAVASLLRSASLGPEDLIVITDDVALPWGSLRIRERGRSGGHHGLESVIAALGTDEFPRLRLGIEPGSGVEDLPDYVLQPLSPQEWERAEEMVEQAAEAVRAILREGIKRAMTRFNRRVSAPASS